MIRPGVRRLFRPPFFEKPSSPAAAGGVAGPRRQLGGFPAAAVVLVLSGLVAIASRHAVVWTSLRSGAADRSELLARVAVAGAAGAVAAFALTLLAHRFRLDGSGTPPLRDTFQRAVPITSVALAALILLTIARTELDPGIRGAPRAGPAQVSERTGGRPPGRGLTDSRAGLIVEGEDRRPDADGGADTGRSALPSPMLLALLAAIAAIAAGAVGAAFWWSRARRSAAPGLSGSEDGSGSHPDVEPLRGAVLGTIDAMLADPDPNTAIVGAYARLLEGLAACGVERRAHEAPLEHLRRVFATLRVRPEPARRLVELFQIARFSTHRLTAAHREQALEALHAVAADLAGAGAGGGWRPAGSRR